MTISKGLRFGFVVATGLAASSVGACTASITTDNGDAGPTLTGDGGRPDVAVPIPDGGTDVTTPPIEAGPPAATGVGTVNITETVSAMSSTTVSLNFQKTAPTPGVQPTVMGACSGVTVDLSGATGGTPTASELTGKASVSGGNFMMSEGAEMPEATTGAISFTHMGLGWEDPTAGMPGPNLVLSTVGAPGGVPMIMETLVAPGDGALSQPACDMFKCAGFDGTQDSPLDKSVDLTVKWSNAVTGAKVRFSIQTTDSGTKKGYSITCIGDATTKTLTVPKELLGNLLVAGAAPSTVSGFTNFDTYTEATAVIGNYNTVFQVSQSTPSESGSFVGKM